MTSYADKKTRLLAALAQRQSGTEQGRDFGLAKATSNLFRDRAPRTRPKLDLSHFDGVERVDTAAGIVEAEGMVRYVDLADATLPHGVMPGVVPQLKSITLGGAVAGVGIEASSFRRGLVHDTIEALDVLTGDGRIVSCTAENEHSDLFRGFPNSYGTLGYALRIVARVIPVKPYVALEHVRYTDPAACFAEVARACVHPDSDFLDGVVFARNELYLTRGRFVEQAPCTSDYTFERIYYRSIRERRSDYLKIRDYIWRWDTDWFWCSKNVGAQNAVLRRVFGRNHLNSITYQRIMRWNSRWGLTRAWSRLAGVTSESVIQDVDIPLERAEEFLDFFHSEIGILPVWICPIRAPDPARTFALYPLRPDKTYVNFGFWDVVRDRAAHPPGHYNRKIEHKVAELGGIKSLYSDSYFTEEEFWTTYNRDAYVALKRKYDPTGVLGDLYAKCVKTRVSTRAT